MPIYPIDGDGNPIVPPETATSQPSPGQAEQIFHRLNVEQLEVTGQSRARAHFGFLSGIGISGGGVRTDFIGAIGSVDTGVAAERTALVTVASTTLYGGYWYMQTVAAAPAASANVVGTRVRTEAGNTSGSLNQLFGIIGEVKASGSGGTVAAAYAIQADAHTSAGATITDMYLVNVRDVSNSGTITNLYGLYVQDVDQGATLNYAIYTNAGLVRFGDNLTLTNGDLDIESGDLLLDGSLKGANLRRLGINTAFSEDVGILLAPQFANANATGVGVDMFSGASGTAVKGVASRVKASNAATVTNAYAAFLQTSTLTGTGTITNNYGLYIEAQTAGGTLNYAIYTNAGTVRLGGDLVLASQRTVTSTGTQNDFDIEDDVHMEWDGGAGGAVTFNGFNGPTAGRLLVLSNESTAGIGGNITLNHDNGGSTAANRIWSATAGAVTVQPDQTVWLIYSGNLSRWLITTPPI